MQRVRRQRDKGRQVIFENQLEIQRLETANELRDIGVNPYPHFLRRDMDITKFRLKFKHIIDTEEKSVHSEPGSNSSF